jgi:hypothetical protein
VPEAEVLLVIEGALPAAAIVKVSVAVPVPDALVAPITTELVPLTVGVPLMPPVPEFTASPAGNPLALKLVGVLLAVI